MDIETKAQAEGLRYLNDSCGKREKRKALIFMAKSSERAERYKDMCAYMKELAITYSADLTKEERDLLIIGYKRVLGDVRQSWVNLKTVDDSKLDELRKEYMEQIEKELIQVCNDGLDLFEKVLAQAKTSNSESRVFYLKTSGDYYRYLAEIQKWCADGKNRAGESSRASASPIDKNVAKKASEYYKQAMAIAEAKLPPTSPILLDVALNYSVCVHEILKETKQACFLAKTAFDAAISKLDDLDDATYKDSTLIMQLLRDNLTLWTSDRSDRSRRSHHR